MLRRRKNVKHAEQEVCEVSMPSERDAEIIKAIGGCINSHTKCNECLFIDEVRDGEDCKGVALVFASNIINRQKVENMRLRSQISRLKQYDEERDIRLHAKLVQKARAEATSEFVEQVKSAFDRYGMEHDCYAIVDEVAKKIGSGAV